jgi:hypothetical protein
MSGADLIEYRLDRLEKSDDKKIELIEKVSLQVDTIVKERLLEKQRDRWIMAILVFVSSFAMEYIKKLIGV